MASACATTCEVRRVRWPRSLTSPRPRAVLISDTWEGSGAASGQSGFIRCCRTQVASWLRYGLASAAQESDYPNRGENVEKSYKPCQGVAEVCFPQLRGGECGHHLTGARTEAWSQRLMPVCRRIADRRVRRPPRGGSGSSDRACGVRCRPAANYVGQRASPRRARRQGPGEWDGIRRRPRTRAFAVAGRAGHGSHHEGSTVAVLAL